MIKALSIAVWVLIGIMLVVLLTGCSTPDSDEALDNWFAQNPASCNAWTGGEIDKDKYLRFVQDKSGTSVSRVAIWDYLDKNC